MPAISHRHRYGSSEVPRLAWRRGAERQHQDLARWHAGTRSRRRPRKRVGISASLRGLGANLELSPRIDGSGAFQLLPTADNQPPRIALDQAAHIEPLDGLGADASFLSRGDMLKLSLGVDLPGPIPLFNTGLAIYGIGGVFAHNGAADALRRCTGAVPMTVSMIHAWGRNNPRRTGTGRGPYTPRFPKGSPDWYIHLGADGPPVPAGQGRDAGPVRALILPDVLGQEADAYLMLRGNGVRQTF